MYVYLYISVTVAMARLVTAGQTASLGCVSRCPPTTLCLDNVISNCVTQARASLGRLSILYFCSQVCPFSNFRWTLHNLQFNITAQIHFQAS